MNGTAPHPAAAVTQYLHRPSNRRIVQRNAWTLAVYGLLLISIVYEKIIHPNFGSFEILSLVVGALPLAFAAMAQTSVVLAGGIDLSVGPVVGVVNVVAATWMMHTDVKGAILISLAIMALTGLGGALTGLIITLTRVPDIIVTLATSFVWGGIALEIMNTPGGGGAPVDFVNLSSKDVFGVIPEALFILLAALIIIWLPFSRSRPGLEIYALGSNRTAAYLSGVSVTRARITAYALGGVFTALAGLMLTASSGGTGDPNAGTAYTLQSVAAVVLGGVALSGGRGGMLGPVAASFILFTIGTIFTYLGVDPNWATVYQGAIVVAVVMIAGLLAIRRRT